MNIVEQLDKAYEMLDKSMNYDGDWKDIVEQYDQLIPEVMEIILDIKRNLTK